MALVETTWEGHIATIRMNRPEVLNALNTAMIEALQHALYEVEGRHDIRVVVLAGSAQAFSTGADLKERAALTDAEWRAQHRTLEATMRSLRELRQPTIAAVSGWAVGGGCELALSCDIIVATRTAQFGQPEVRRGLFPGAGGTQLLPRRLARGLAKYLIFTGDTIDGETAWQQGLVTRLADSPEALEVLAHTMAARIAEAAPSAVQAAKRAMRWGLDKPLEEAIAFDLEAWYRQLATGEPSEGAKAFAEKRQPRYHDPV